MKHPNAPFQAYKAFGSDLCCNAFQYEVGKEYKEEGKPLMCSRGFHACLCPLDCLHYYNLLNSRFATVTIFDDFERWFDKVCTNRIRIDRELSLEEFISLSTLWFVKRRDYNEYSEVYSDVTKRWRRITDSDIVLSECDTEIVLNHKANIMSLSSISYISLWTQAAGTAVFARGNQTNIGGCTSYADITALGTSSSVALSGNGNTVRVKGEGSNVMCLGYGAVVYADGFQNNVAVIGDHAKVFLAETYASAYVKSDFAAIHMSEASSKVEAQGKGIVITMSSVLSQGKVKASEGTIITAPGYSLKVLKDMDDFKTPSEIEKIQKNNKL